MFIPAVVDQTALIAALESPGNAPYVRFAASDDQGATLDCLKIVEDAPQRYLGVSHALRDGVFELRLSESTDLLHWQYVAVLDRHAHQGTLRRVGVAWLVAYEKDGPDGNWIELAAYPTTADLRAAKPERRISLPRTLSRFAQGTPDIRSVAIQGTWDRSEVALGFHYYRDGDVDRQSFGVLRDWRDWTERELLTTNRALEDQFRGNIGDRDTLQWGHETLMLLEAQRTKNDWASWTILFGPSSAPFRELHIRTPDHARSFANPNWTKVTLPDGRPGIAVTLFLPSQGASTRESGSLIYAFPITAESLTSSGKSMRRP